MNERRLGVGPYVAAVGVVLALQAGVLSLDLADPLKFGLVAALQLLKLPATRWRLHDLGRSPDDVFWAVLPIANVLLGLLCLQGTPKPQRRERAIATWAGQLSAFGALAAAFPVLAQTAGVGGAAVVAFAVVAAVVGRWVVWQLGVLEALPLDTRGELGAVLTGFAGFLLLYALIQLPKRATASRASWAPVLLLAPTLVLLAIVNFLDQSKMGMGLAFMVFLQTAWLLLWASFGGAAATIAWVRSAQGALDGAPVPASAVFSEVGRRWLEVAGPHGTRVQAVTIGMQVVIPGIFYWLQLAFTDAIAVLHPDESAVAGSGKLTWGMRGRLFKLWLVTGLVWMAGSAGLAAAMGVSAETIGMSLLGMADPREPSMAQLIAQEVWAAVVAWWTTVALLILYRERVARRDRRAREAQQAAAAAAAPVDAPDETPAQG